MNNTARNAMIICGDGTRPARDDTKTYQQNPPQPTASSRPRYSPSPMHHLRLFIAIFRLSLFPLFAMFPPYSPIISPPLVPTHSLLFSPTLPSLVSFSFSLHHPIPLPFIPLPASFHFPYRFVPLQAPSNILQIRLSRLRSRTAHEGVNTNLTCSEPGRTNASRRERNCAGRGLTPERPKGVAVSP